MRKSLKSPIGIGLILSFAVLSVPSTSAAETNPYGGIAVKAPGANETILVVSKGKVVVNLSMKKLQSMKSKTISINEPFVKKVQSFRVIKLSAIFLLAGIKGTDKVDTHALNDYVYSNSAAKFLSANGYLAISRSGKPIGYDEGGPIRIIFEDSSKWAKFLDPWNWSLKKIKVS